jgi:hypothetical protein
MFNKKRCLCLLLIVLVLSCQPRLIIQGLKYDYSGMDVATIDLHKSLERFINETRQSGIPIYIDPRTRIDSLRVDLKAHDIRVFLSKHFSFIPLREDNVRLIYDSLRKSLARKYRSFRLTVYSLGQPLDELIPNYYRSSRQHYDKTRLSLPGRKWPVPLTRREKDFSITKGLAGNHIALWNSHGWYYSHDTRRWEWQRPRLFQTVEDLLPTAIVLPYLIPMLENAGAVVFTPRERDIQTNEVIVDNDSTPAIGAGYSEQAAGNRFIWRTGDSAGFAVGRSPYKDHENPFTFGTSRLTLTDTAETASAEWIPMIPDTGDYAVYVSYSASAMNAEDARYSIFHAGGRTDVRINQQIGGHTWIYAGTFRFNRGFNPEFGRVKLSNFSAQPGLIVSADAVRFGGGMGCISRGETVSERPRFMEAARYYMQYAGMPDSLVFDLNNGRDDYKDDYQCRAEYVNYLYGAPFGPNKNRNAKGLGIPIDLSLAFHTDAGISFTDTTIGTLSIYSVADADTKYVFPDGVSRMANRDFADILQSQIVDDIRVTFDPKWRRRQLMESQYSEAFRPNVPAALLELLSHQNLLDMKFIQDPRFRFTIGRAIYKAMLRFLAVQNNREYMVQPLPVSHFRIKLDKSGRAQLEWQAQDDPLEPGAKAHSYRIYTRRDDGGFDNGHTTNRPLFVTEILERGVIYSYKITALNEGGESFPSEILSVCDSGNDKPTVLIVNGFDRICGPAVIETPGFSGFASFIDPGVPDRFDLNFTGVQHNFDPASVYRLNDAPGHGASGAENETTLIPGNSFDYPYLHGLSILHSGFSFASCSDEAIADSLINLTDFTIVDWILGQEKETGWPKPEMDAFRGKSFKAFPYNIQQQIKKYTERGGNLFISGAYVGQDLFQNRDAKHTDVAFGRTILKMEWVDSYASGNGVVYTAAKNNNLFPAVIHFNTSLHSRFYRVSSADAINPVNGSRTLFRYQENQFSAGIALNDKYKLIVLGFPFETILSGSQRDHLMQAVLNYFKK